MDSDSTHALHIVSVMPAVFWMVLGVLTLPFFFFLAWYSWYHWRYRRIVRAAKLLPKGYPTLPLLGHAYVAVYKDLPNMLCRYAKGNAGKRESTHCAWFGPHPIFLAMSADNIQTVIFGSQTEKGDEYVFLKFALGRSLILAPDHVHKVTRRHMNPLLQPRNLEQLMPDFNESSRHFVHDLSQHVNKGHVEVSRPATSVTIRNIANVIFGHEVNIDIKSEDFLGLIKAANGIGRVMFRRFFRPWLWSEIVFECLCQKEITEIDKGWRRFAEEHLKKLKCQEEKLEKQEKYSKPIEEVSAGEVPSYLTLPALYECLQQKHPEFTDRDMHQEMMTLIIAGSDTSKIAIASCLLTLAAHAEIQEQLYREISSVMGFEDRDVTTEDIKNMPYLDQVFKETLRKYSIIPFIFRRAKEDIKLSDCTIPAGGTICVSLISLHFDPSIYPDPERFDPERFAPQRVTSMKKHYFLPFSGGARSCIGAVYSALLVKTVVVHMLRRYRLTTPMDISRLKYKLGMALISDRGYLLELHNR